MRTTALRTLALTIGATAFAACGLLDTEQPNLIDPGNLDSPAGAEALRDGALAEFAFAKDGDGNQEEDGLILVGGLMADEFMHSTTPPSQQEIDQRTPSRDNGSVSDPYTNLHQARAAAERAVVALEQFSLAPDETPDIAEMLSIIGYSYILFAEHYCSGVPFGRAVGDSLDYGSPLTTAEMFDTALARFDLALGHPGLSGDDGTITSLAMVGRGRALVGLGRFADAAAAVAAVPTDFVYSTEHAESPLRIQNAIWSYTSQGLWSVSDGEGGAGVPFRTAQDARVAVDSTIDEETGEVATGLDLITPQYTLLKYNADSDVPLADGVEARLIEAEAALQASDFGGMTTLLNDPRGAAGLDPLAAPATQEDAIDLLFSERAFWLFATGHRLGDMRRLVRPSPTGYGLQITDVFPTGAYHKGGSYGGDVNFPIPIGEENRPEEVGGRACLDRNP